MDSARAKAEVLRYLGHKRQAVPKDVDKLVDECMALMRNTASPRDTRAVFGLTARQDGLFLDGTEVRLPGEDIARYLSGCGQAVLFAATLGSHADSLVRRDEYVDLTRSVILDACATQLIEENCDELEAQIQSEYIDRGLYATSRFSPGYGDFAIDIQPKLLALLDANRKIGLTCTESLILLPRKSVTALIGLGKTPKSGGKTCDSCNLRDECAFRKDNAISGCSKIY